MADDNDDYDDLVKTQRLKAAIHYTVGRISVESEEETGIMYSRHFIAAVSEATYKYSQTVARDLELFAKHAKRTTVNTDDVLMVVRKSKKLCDYMKEYAEDLNAEREKVNVKRKEKKKKTSGAGVAGETGENDTELNEESNQ